MGNRSILLFDKFNIFNDVKFWIEVGIYVIKLFEIVNVSRWVSSPMNRGMKEIWFKSSFKDFKFLNNLKLFDIFSNLLSRRSILTKLDKFKKIVLWIFII